MFKLYPLYNAYGNQVWHPSPHAAPSGFTTRVLAKVFYDPVLGAYPKKEPRGPRQSVAPACDQLEGCFFFVAGS